MSYYFDHLFFLLAVNNCSEVFKGQLRLKETYVSASDVHDDVLINWFTAK